MDYVRILAAISGLFFTVWFGLMCMLFAVRHSGKAEKSTPKIARWVVFVLWVIMLADALGNYAILRYTQKRFDRTYREFVVACEEFDLVCSNLGTVTYPLMSKVYENAERWNGYIREVRKAQGGIYEDFYDKRFVTAPLIILSKMHGWQEEDQ